MAYIGKQPVVGNFVKLDAITTSATATYNLLNGGVAYFPQTANNCIVSLNGVIQSPTSAYTISGSTIVFDSALTSSDTIDFILVLGDVLAIGTPSDSTVSFSKVTSNLITGATAETSIAGGDSILIYDDSATALRKMTRTNFVSGLGITEADQWRITADLSLANDVDTVISANLERVDTDGFALLGTGMTQSSGVFSFPSTGYWRIYFNAIGTGTGIDPYAFCILQTTTDGTNFDNAAQSVASVPVANHYFNVSGNFIFDCTNTTTHKIRFRQYANTSNSKFLGTTDVNQTYFTFIKLAET